MVAVLCLAILFFGEPQTVRALESQTLPILLVNGAIYPRFFDPHGLPPAFRVDPPGGGKEALFLLQFAGQVREDWLEEMKGRGAKPRGYLAYNSVLAAMDAGTYSKIKGLSFVFWSGLYQPYYKISPALQLRLVQGGKVTALAQVYDANLLGQVMESLQAMPVEVLAWGGDSWCGIVVLRLPVEELREIAAMPEVEWLDLAGAGTLPSTWISGRGGMDASESVRTARASGSSATKPSGNPESVAVSDTGKEPPSGGVMPEWFTKRLTGPINLSGAGDAVFSDHATATTMVLLAGDTLDERQPMFRPLRAILYLTGYGMGIPQFPVSMFSLLEDAYSRGARVFLSGSVPEGRESLTRYGTYSSQRDAFAWSRQDMLLVEPAGNEGTDQDGDGRVDTGSILGGSCAKNVISVGGCESAGDASTGESSGMAAFSSRGPTDDGRIKPDLVEPATGIPLISAGGEGGSSAPVRWRGGAYVRAFGTSLAAALLAGDAALLRAAVRSRTGNEPSAALVKAILINMAQDLYPGQYGEENPEVPRAPNPIEGWGRPDGSWTGESLSWLKLVDDMRGLRMGDTRIYRVDVQSMSELRVTLAWTDYPSLPQSRMRLVNDLDLRVIGPGGESYYPNGRHSRDPLNNTERVVIEVNGRPGKYTVEVKAWNVPMAPQPYALIIQGR